MYNYPHPHPHPGMRISKMPLNPPRKRVAIKTNKYGKLLKSYPVDQLVPQENLP
jgi:hypothetical protein